MGVQSPPAAHEYDVQWNETDLAYLLRRIEEETIHVQSGKLYKLLAQEKYEGEAKVWEIRAEDRLLISAPGGYIEIDKSGIRIRGLKVDIEGNRIAFKKGGPGEGATCLRQMAQSATPFVRM